MNKFKPVITKRYMSSQVGRSSLFNKDPSLKQVRERIKKDENQLNRYEADVTRLRTVRDDATNQFGKSASNVFRAELVYSADLDSVLSMLRRSSA